MFNIFSLINLIKAKFTQFLIIFLLLYKIMPAHSNELDNPNLANEVPFLILAGDSKRSESVIVLSEICKIISEDKHLSNRYPLIFMADELDLANFAKIENAVRNSTRYGAVQAISVQGQYLASLVEKLRQHSVSAKYCHGAVSEHQIDRLSPIMLVVKFSDHEPIVSAQKITTVNNENWRYTTYSATKLTKLARALILGVLLEEDDINRYLNVSINAYPQEGYSCATEDRCVVLGGDFRIAAKITTSTLLSEFIIGFLNSESWNLTNEDQKTLYPTVFQSIKTSDLLSECSFSALLKISNIGKYILHSGIVLSILDLRKFTKPLDLSLQVNPPAIVIDSSNLTIARSEIQFDYEESYLLPPFLKRGNRNFLRNYFSGLSTISAGEYEEKAKSFKHELLSIELPRTPEQYLAILKKALNKSISDLSLVDFLATPIYIQRGSSSTGLFGTMNSNSIKIPRSTLFCDKVAEELFTSAIEEIKQKKTYSIDMKTLLGEWDLDCANHIEKWETKWKTQRNIDAVQYELVKNSRLTQHSAIPELTFAANGAIISKYPIIPIVNTLYVGHHNVDSYRIRFHDENGQPSYPLNLKIVTDAPIAFSVYALGQIRLLTNLGGNNLTTSPVLAGGAAIGIQLAYNMIELSIGFMLSKQDIEYGGSSVSSAINTWTFEADVRPWCYAGTGLVRIFRFCRYAFPSILLGASLEKRSFEKKSMILFPL